MIFFQGVVPQIHIGKRQAQQGENKQTEQLISPLIIA